MNKLLPALLLFAVFSSASAMSETESLMDAFRDRIAVLRENSGNSWADHHLKSILDVADTQYRNLEYEPDMSPKWAAATQHILEKLPVKKLDFDTHVRHGLPFVFAFVSDEDHSMQHYMVHFPYGYDPGKTYPLTVYLHGSGPNYTMDGMKMAFDNSRQDTLYDWNEIDPENVPAPLRGFLIAPWARGNARYKGLAREDVLQAIEEMRDRFSIDSERMYLTGFSMGSGGAWRLATEKPELWAGVNLASGFDTSNLTEERIEKIREIPFILQVGEKETERVSACEVFYERLKAAGVSVSRYVIEDMPHTYPHALYCRNVDELMQSPR